MLSISTYIQCIAMFIIGQFIYVFWIKVPSLKARAAALNKLDEGSKFEYSELWRCDSHVIIGLNLLGISIFIGLDQLLHFKPEAIHYLKWVFWLVGAFGCTVGFKYFSRYEKTLLDMIDKKSNVSDNTTGPAKTVNEILHKAADIGIDASKHP